MDTPYTCCLCDEPKNGYGNNPKPFESEDDERCCDNCNRCKVIPFRMFLNRCENPEEAVKEPKIIKKFKEVGGAERCEICAGMDSEDYWHCNKGKKEMPLGDFLASVGCVSLERNGKVKKMSLGEFKARAEQLGL